MARENQTSLSVPQVVINNTTVGVVPNTFKFTSGKGEFTHRRASLGGNATGAVFSKNAETFRSMVSFDIFPTPDNITLIADIKAREANNTISATENGKVYSFTNVVITNDPEINTGADAVVSIEAESDPLNT